MEYGRVGRGGAGNFYSQQDLERKTASPPEDIEAQNEAAGTQIDNEALSGSGFASFGRGGAGNFTSSKKLSAATTATIDVTPALQPNRPPESGYAGRGGAGNYRGGIAESKEQDERKASEFQREVHQQVVRDVEMALKEPEKAHLGKEGIEHYPRR